MRCWTRGFGWVGGRMVKTLSPLNRLFLHYPLPTHPPTHLLQDGQPLQAELILTGQTILTHGFLRALKDDQQNEDASIR